MSSADGGSSSGGNGGGILRSSSSQTKKRPPQNTMEVTFGDVTSQAIHRPSRPSPSDQEYDETYRGRAEYGGSANTSNGGGSGGGYDSDDLYDASMAAGGVLPSTGDGNNNDDNNGLPHGQADIDAAKRQRRKLAENAELADRKEEIERIEEEEDDDDNIGRGRGNKMGPASGDGGQGSQKGEFRGEEDLDTGGLSLISSQTDPADPSAISGAYDAGANAACPIEPFNLKAEREGGEGYFDGDTYVFRRLEDGGRAVDEEPDAWLDELGGRDANGSISGGGQGGGGGGAGERGIARLSGTKSTKTKQPALDLDDVSHEELCGRIAALLASDKETVARGLKRYGDVIGRDRKRRQKLAKKKKVGETKMEDGAKTEHGDASGVAAAQKALSDLTELADALLMGGDGEVYSRTREELVRMASASGTGTGGGNEDHLAGHKRKRNYFGGGDEEGANDNGGNGDGSSKMAKINGAAATDQADKKPPVQWEYRGNQDQQIHGPYTTEQILGWIQAGYFVGEAAVDVRRVASMNGGGAGAGEDAATADDLMADLMDSDDEEGGDEKAKTEANAANDWERSDKVDFKSYL